MLLSNIGNYDTPYYRMERAILRLVRGSLYRRLSANEREAAAIEAEVYSLVHSIIDLHRFRDRRLLTIRYKAKRSIESIAAHEHIITDIVENIQIVKEEILYHPFECDIHMDFILTSLDKIVDQYTESKGQIHAKPSSLVETESVENTAEDMELEILGVTDELPTLAKPEILEKPEILGKQKPRTIKARKNDSPVVPTQLESKKPSVPSLPKITTFLTANVGNILYEQGEYMDIGTLNKGESIHERKESRAN
ncbi:hypothetical protein [Paenibacillus arenosi]|uniref:Uncharacterized protein n=1 Tax=Paenibacillus arenosi TaxID=2774142 RepID=A0ABR9AS66_9BACL|nr:hypothetical protein [Paenibacillus arenosi]MBD8496963.1 hypothetical protein [Paenibacillus arenosi]